MSLYWAIFAEGFSWGLAHSLPFLPFLPIGYIGNVLVTLLCPKLAKVRLLVVFPPNGRIIRLVIDVKGHLIGARIYNKTVDELTAFEKSGLKALNLMQDWQVGMHNNKLVNVLMTKIIHIDLNN
ncbi:hypothetical protein [Prevotella sp. OH937_COT-195]|uniref:hypothetical protein n=1 Tax=Prevotella sp. OH937_COT-195 TaxID=2491051 RepID=UPI000F650404|nr:hypothetical protein [Prevotella sp. OH937_COT-195]